MNPLKRLASHTAIYGLSSIFGRFLNYLLVPLFTYAYTPAEYGVVSEFYAYAGFFSVLLLCGFETGYFRFRKHAADGAPDIAYSTALRFLLAVNLGFFFVLILASGALAELLRHGDHPEYVIWMAAILALDAVGAIAFARLRAENRAWRFAGIKIAEILTNVSLCLLFIVALRALHAEQPDSLLGRLWDPGTGVGYIFLANLAASLVKLVLLAPQLRGAAAGFDRTLFGEMLRYSAPMIVIGFAGIINEMIDRVLLKYLLPHDNETNLAQLGIYSACYKLSILMSLFIQAFRYAAEPFFFSYATKDDARRVYAGVLNYFVIFCVFIFLLVTMYLDLFQYFIGPDFRAGLPVVPILLLANLFLGVYVNLSIWYKLTDRTALGAWVAAGGALLTIALNVWWIPWLGYMGAAWATLACYASMALVSWLLGRKYYPVPYDARRVLAYIAFGLSLYFAHQHTAEWANIPEFAAGTALLLVYIAVAWALDGRRLLRRPGT